MISESRTQKLKPSRLFYFWHRLCDQATLVFFCLLLSFLTVSSSPFCSLITLSLLIRRSTLDTWMVSACLSFCLVFQTPSHTAGPLVVLGSTPGMHGMAQWTIRRKYPRAVCFRRPETTVTWTITGEKWKGWRQRVTQEGMDQDSWADKGSIFDKTINILTVASLGSWKWWWAWSGDTWEKKGRNRMGWVV